MTDNPEAADPQPQDQEKLVEDQQQNAEEGEENNEEAQTQDNQPAEDPNEKKLEQKKYSPLNLVDRDFDEQIDKWTKITPHCPPKRRTRHSSFIYDSKLYVVGGIDITEKKQDDIYYINLLDPSEGWQKVELQGDYKLEKIAYHAGVRYGKRYYIVGGQNESLESLNTIQIFNIENNCMEEPIKLDPEKFPGVESHTVCKQEKNLIIYGGKSGKDFNKHVYRFSLETKEIKNLTENLPEDHFPPPRTDHAALVDAGALYIYGGFGPDSKYYDDIWKYDLEGDFTLLKKEPEKAQEGEGEGEEGEGQYQRDVQSNTKEVKNEEPEKPLILLDTRIRDGGEQYDEDLNEDEKLELLEAGIVEEKKEEQPVQEARPVEEKKEEEPEEKNPEERPVGRSGHSMVKIGPFFYIFGGRTDLIKESNELWRFDPSSLEFTLVHDTLLIQFTEEELKKISQSDEKGPKPFHWLTRGEVEKRTNPSFNDKVKSKKKKKGGKDKGGKKGKNDDIDDVTQGKFSDQVLHRPNVIKMRKTLIFTSEQESIKNGLAALEDDEKATLKKDVYKIRGEVPEPRDGQSVLAFKNQLVVFGGDRFKFPFNDLFIYETGGEYDEEPPDEEIENKNEGEEGEEQAPAEEAQ